ncbi:MAG TPA: YajQ family cyclic di-GMP-binding protein [Candidatus Binatia bacterium]
MPSFDIVNRVDLQELDNAVNVARKTIVTRYDFRESKTEITLDKKEKKVRILTEDEMKMRAVQDSLVENLVRRKIDPKVLDAKEVQPTSGGMIQREIAIKEGVDTDTARAIVKLIKGLHLKVQAAIQDQQVRVTGKQIDDLQSVIKAVRAANIGVPLQFSNMAR